MGSWSRWAVTAAIGWSILLVVGAFTVPLYRGMEGGASSDGTTWERELSGTLVGVNGPWALVPVSVPLVGSVVVALLLRAGRRWTWVLAWAVTALVGALAVLGMFTIGVFVLPVFVALVVACAAATLR